MLKNSAERIHHLRKKLKLSQEAIGETLGISASAVSYKEGGKSDITANDAIALNKKYGVNISWLFTGKGEMFDEGREQEVKPAETRPGAWDMPHIRERFRIAVEDYKIKHKINQAELAEQWDLSPQYLSNVMTGGRDVTMQMIINCMRYGGININYIIGGVGGIYFDGSNVLEEGNKLDLLIKMVRQQGQDIHELQSKWKKVA